MSAVAAPASAAYICDVSQGNVEVSVDTEGNKSIKVGGVAVEDNGDGKDEIIITGDNTKSTASLNAEEENTSEAEKSAEVEKSGENTSEVEKSGEDTAEAEKTGEDTGETEEQAQGARLSGAAGPGGRGEAGPGEGDSGEARPTLRSRSRPKRPPIR